MKNKTPYSAVILLISILTIFSLAGCAPANNNASVLETPQIAKPTTTSNEIAPQIDETGPQIEAQTPLSQNRGGETDDEKRVIQLIAANNEAAAYLANYPTWWAEAYREEGEIWGADFYNDEEAEEWLGYGAVNLAAGEIVELYAPQELSQEEFQAGQAAVQSLVLNDAEVLALLGNPDQWDYDVEYERYEQMWVMWFGKGLQEWLVLVYEEDGRYGIEEIIDPNLFDEAEQYALAQDQAIELAYSADGIDEALAGSDDWRTYVENQGDSRWSVSFVSNGETLFQVLVDLDTEEITPLETTINN